MLIKPKKTAAADATEPASVPAPETPVIADRLKLDAVPTDTKKKSGGKAALVAVIAGVLALAVAGLLTFIIYQHWEFLQSA